MNKKIIGPLKLWHIIALGAAVGLYYWYKNRSASSAGASTGQTGGLIDPATGVPYSLEATDPTTGLPYSSEIGAGYAGSLGGSSTTGPTGSPIDALGQELSDLQGINSELQQFGFGGIQPTTDANPATATDPGLVSTATGAAPAPSPTATVAKITTHPSGAFYKYYTKVTGHAPPTTLNTTNLIYQMWKSGVKATAAKAIHATTTVTRNATGGTSTPGHTVSTHNTGQKSPKTNGLTAGKHTGKTVASNNHQKITSHTPVNNARPVAAAPAGTHSQPPAAPKPKPERKPRPTRRRGP